LTSAADDDAGPDQMPRIRDFRENVERGRDGYDGVDSNLVHGNDPAGRDGMSFSL
jgi:hypothetical protein